MNTLEQTAALKDGRIDVGFGRLRFDTTDITRTVLREDKVIAALPAGHGLLAQGRPLSLQQTAPEPLILYPKSPRPSYADQVLAFYRNQGIEPKVAFEVGELQTALGLVAAGAGICLVPASVRHLVRHNVVYADFDVPKLVSPVIMSHRARDQSVLLKQLVALIHEYDLWQDE